MYATLVDGEIPPHSSLPELVNGTIGMIMQHASAYLFCTAANVAILDCLTTKTIKINASTRTVRVKTFGWKQAIVWVNYFRFSITLRQGKTF